MSDEQTRRRSAVWWVLVTFATRGFTALAYAGTVPAIEALEGGGRVTLIFLLFGIGTGLNALSCAAWLVPKGRVWERRDSGGRLRRWIPRVKQKKYDKPVYSLSGGNRRKMYLVCAGIAFVTDAVNWTAGIGLVEEQLSISLVAFLAWASNCWLPIWRIRLWRRELGAVELLVPLVGFLQLGGVAIASGVLSGGGIDPRLTENPVLLVMVAGLVVNSIAVAALGAYMKKTRLKEEAHLKDEGVGKDTVEYHLYLSFKLAYYPNLPCFAACVVGFVVAGCLTGFPVVQDWGLMMLAVGIYAIASIGNRVGKVALAEGDPAFAGIGAAGGLGFTFVWARILQGIVPKMWQVFGAGLTLLGAIVWAAVMVKREHEGQKVEPVLEDSVVEDPGEGEHV